jgi:hypothetical protein
MTLIYIQAYILLCCLALAGKDADSYQLKDKQDNALSAGRVKRWHRDGVILYLLLLVPVCYYNLPAAWKIVVAAGLIRLAFFDLAFNWWAPLSIHYLGSTAWLDKLFVKVFGINGAVKKSLTFFTLLVLLNLLNHFL